MSTKILFKPFMAMAFVCLALGATAQSVVSVGSSTLDGTYIIGDQIDVEVEFDLSVTVTGTPQLELETGTVNRQVDYSNGSGSKVLTFSYTIQEGDESGKLEYVATSSLALNGGSIKNGAINASLTLPGISGGNSLSDNTAFEVDGIRPSVSSMTSTSTNGYYKAGDLIAIVIQWDDNVFITGTPQLELETGATDQDVDYGSGSNSKYLTFYYLVQSSDESTDLDYTGTGALALNGGTIKDANGNAATLTLAAPGSAGSLGKNRNLIIDNDEPTVANVSASTNNGIYKKGDIINITVNFSEDVFAGGTPKLELETGATDQDATYYSGSGSNSWVFQYTVQTGDGSSDLDYTGTSALKLNGGNIRDNAGNDALLTLATPGATNSLGDNKNLIIDTEAPIAPSISGITDDNGAGGDGITNDQKLVISGTAEASSVVFVFRDGANVGSSTADGSGDWTFDYTTSTLSEGSYVFTAKAEDAAGNLSVASGDFDVEIDLTKPGSPSVVGISSDNGFSASDKLTNDTGLEFIGTAEAFGTVEVFIGGSSIGTTVADGSGDWTFDHTATALSQGSYLITAQTTDRAGNTGLTSPSLSITLDLSVPAAPMIAGISVDDGSSSSDGVTTDQTLVFTGTAEADSKVEIFFGASSIATVTADGNGDWVFDHTGTSLTEGSYSVTAKANDAAGNTSSASTTFNLKVDLTPPNAPAVSAISDDSGASSTDEVTNDQTLEFIGTAEAMTTVEVFVKASSIGTTTADGSGDWTFDYTGAVLAEGNYAITATATDAVNKTSSVSAKLNITIDLTSPNAPIAVSISTDSGISSSDELTNDQTLEFVGTAEALATVEVFVDASSIGTTTADGNGDWTFDHTLTSLATGNYAITAEATDAAGNTSATSATLSIEVDVTAPNAPALTSVSNDNGKSNSDELTNDQTLKFIGTAEANSTVEVFIDASSIGITTTDGSGDWTYDHTSTSLASGSYSVTAEATDAAGNTSITSATLSVSIDITAPNAPVVVSISNDSGISNSDELTNDQGLEFIGTAEANSTVQVFINASSIGTTMADGSGDWTFDHTGKSLLAGTYSITAKSIDDAGNTSLSSATLFVEIDITVNAPIVTGISNDTGISSSDENTSDQTLEFIGTAEANSSVEVFVDASSIGTTTTDGNGDWTYDYTGTSLSAGTYSITTKAIDEAGNLSVTSSGFSVTIDLTTPAVPVLSGISSDQGKSGSDELTNDQTLKFIGTAEANSTVEVFIDASSIGTTTADGSGDWTYNHESTPLAAGNYSITAETTDAAGNTSPTSSALPIEIDITAPGKPVVVSISNDSGTSGSDELTNDQTLLFTGTAEANITVEVFINTSSIGTTVSDGSGDWTFDHTATSLSAGSYSVTATAIDDAGNTSPSSDVLSVEIDLISTTPIVANISTDSGISTSDKITTDQTLEFIGTAEGNSSVEVFVNALSVGTTTADVNGDWTYDYTGTSLSAGTYSVTAQATDEAGNISSKSSGLSIEIDLTAPNAPILTGISNDHGTSNSDQITRDQTLKFKGTAEANSTVRVYIDALSIGITATDGSGNWTFDHTSTSLAAGSYAITAKATDAAGNTSPTSGTLSVEIDITAPLAPVVSSISKDSGVSGTDELTNDQTLEFIGTAEANSTVEVFIDASSMGTTTADGSGDWTFDHTSTSLVAGSYSVTATAIDAAGNVSTASGTLSIEIDVKSAAPVLTGISTDTGISSSDEITSDQTLEFIGTAEANSSVELFVDASSVGTTTADGSGDWTYDHTGTLLAAGTYSITAKATDKAGNVSALSSGLSIEIITAAPSVPVVASISSDNGSNASDELTNDPTLEFTGTADASNTIEVFIDASSIGTTTSDGSGDWTFDHTATSLSEGTYSVTAKATNISGIASGLSAKLSVEIDLTVPSQPVVSSIGTDGGSSNSDGITNDQTLFFYGKAEALSTVEVFIDGSSIGTTLTTVGGSWTFDYTGTALSADEYTLTTKSMDDAGNTSVVSADFELVVDVVATVPTITAISDDNGSSSSDGITNDQNLIIQGTSEALGSIDIYVGASKVGTTTADLNGDWTLSYPSLPSVLSEGSYTIKAELTDVAGNVSTKSIGFDVAIDITAPNAPVVSSISDDTGISGSDELTSDPRLKFFGTAEAKSEVEVFIDASSIGTVTADANGDWTFDHTGTSLSNGTYAITAKATDVAGNTGATSSTLSIQVDMTAPNAPVVASISNDSGVSGSDGLTNDQTLEITGTAEANSAIVVSIGGSAIGTTTTDGSGDWKFDYTGTSLVEDSYSITAQSTDDAGNTSVASSVLSITIDLKVAAPVVSAISSDNGLSSSDAITNDPTLEFIGTAEANSSIEVFVNASNVGKTTSDANGDWTFDYTGTSLSSGVYKITAKAIDAAGNIGAISSELIANVDAVAPNVPVFTGISNDSGVSSSDELTNDPTLEISGTAEAGSELTLKIGGTSIGTLMVPGSGSWTYNHTGVSLSEGVHTFTATATDTAGNTSSVSSDFEIEIDITSPVKPVIAGISDDSGLSASDGITNDPTLKISGTAEANSSLTLYSGASKIGTVNIDVNGAWLFDYTGTTLSAGDYSFSAMVTDAAGNVSASSVGFGVTIDLTKPLAASITGITTDGGLSTIDRLTNDQELVLDGTAEANGQVELFLGISSIGKASANGSGKWSFDYTGTTLAEGKHSFTATVTDSAGNVAPISTQFNVRIDVTKPNTPAISSMTTDNGLSTTDRLTNDQTLAFGGASEANTSIAIYDGAVLLGTVGADGSGKWSFDYTSSSLTEGAHSITTASTDSAGNVSNRSSKFNIRIDLTAPKTPVVISISADNGLSTTDALTNDPTLLIAGTSDANSHLSLFINGNSVGTTIADGSGKWSFDYTGTTLLEGAHLITASATDSAANTSAKSGAYRVRIDLTKPVQTSISSISNDSGVSTTDGLTNDPTLTISGKSEANGQVEVFLGALSLGEVDADNSGAWTFDYTSKTLSEGGYLFTAATTDSAGNIGATSTKFKVRVDLTDPAMPIFSSISNDNGLDTDDQLTNDPTLLFLGTAEANSLIDIYDGVTKLGTTSVDGSGKWSFDYTSSSLAEGSHTLTAYAIDSAGNVSTVSDDYTVRIDLTKPGKPAIAAISTDSGSSSSDNITNDQTLLISGTAEAHSQIKLLNGLSTTAVLKTDVLGKWSYDYGTTTLAEGQYIFTVLSTDSAGNVSDSSAKLEVTIDTTAPKASKVAAITTDGEYNEGETISIALAFPETVSVIGTPKLELETGATDASATYVSGSGTKSLTFEYKIASQNSSPDLENTSVKAFRLDGATILDIAGNEVDSLLPTLGGGNSLADNSDVIVNAKPLIASLTAMDACGGDTARQQLSVSDIDDASSNLVVKAFSANTSLVSNSNIFVVGTSGSKTIKVLPTIGQAGTTTVTVYVEDDNGSMDSTTFSVTVRARPTADFQVSTECQEDSTRFTDKSSTSHGNVIGWNWDFADGQSSTLQNPGHLYALSDIYSVKLTVTTDKGCTNTTTLNATVHPKPVADFVFSAACEDQEVQFIDSSSVYSGSISSYSWDFGDVSTSSKRNPNNIYTDTGSYRAQLMITTDKGCSDTLVKTVSVNEGPKAVFSFSNVCLSDSVRFINGSTNASGAVYEWSFGDSTQSILENPAHGYKVDGYFNVKMAVSSLKGCRDSITQTVRIYSLPTIDFSTSDVCENEVMNFSNSSTGATKYQWSFGDGNNAITTDTDHGYATAGGYAVKLIGTSANGCVDSIQKTVNVNAVPTASFAWTTECLTDTTQLTNLSKGASAYVWNYGDGSGTTLSAPNHLFGKAGSFDISLVATSNKGCKDTVLNTVTVNALPIVQFNINDTCDSKGVTINNTTTGAATYNWTFGDGNASKSTNPPYTYAGDGSYSVQLVATTNLGCSDSISRNVDVYPLPVVNFSQTDVCEGESVVFKNTSSIKKGVNAYDWNFGDGTSANNVSPTYQYGKAGSYTVRLIATSNEGCKDSTDQITTTHPQPKADFTSANECFGESLKFSNQTNMTTSTDWSFGDGSIATLEDPTHNYLTQGTYRVQLVAKTANCADSITKTFRVYPKPIAGFNNDSVCFGESVRFTNTSYNGTLRTNKWFFGDGDSSMVANPEHKYKAFGSYTTSLVVGTDDGCFDTATVLSVVHPLPETQFALSDICITETVVSNNQSSIATGTIDESYWEFGDGVTSTNFNVTRTFSRAGIYKVSLKNTSDYGCVTLSESFVEINEQPIAAFSVEDNCFGFQTPFESTSDIGKGKIDNYAWSFGDGNTAALAAPVHLYQAANNYSVELIVESNKGCKDTLVKSIRIFEKPVADFTAANVCQGLTTQFSNTSVDATKYQWDFADGIGSSVLKDPTYLFVNPGDFDITLYTESGDGCLDTVIKTITVYEPPVANFSVENHCFDFDFVPIESSIGDIADWNWSYGDGIQSNDQTPVHTYRKDGSYVVNLLVTTTDGCEDSVKREVSVWPLPTMEVRSDTIVSKGYEVKLWASGGQAYTWSPAVGLNRADVSTPIATVTEDITYEVTMATEFGCESDTLVQLFSRDDYVVEPSNIITPDGNGKNDFWVVDKAQYYNDVEVIVFDRWGRVVFTTTAYDNTWDATVNGKQLPDGVYYYVIKVPYERDEYKGSITVFR